VTFVAVVPIGLGFAFHEGINWRKLKDLEVQSARAQSALEDHKVNGHAT
jgi:hypothetical protein